MSKDPAMIMEELELFTGTPLLPGRMLLFFDEIQECEDAFNSLKYFCEETQEYQIITAESLIRVAVRKKNMKVPAGKVSIVKMFPITFAEFLMAEDERTFEYVDRIEKPVHLPTVIFNRLAEEFRRNHISGGMPEAVTAPIDGRGTAAVDDILQNNPCPLRDPSKYAPP